MSVDTGRSYTEQDMEDVVLALRDKVAAQKEIIDLIIEFVLSDSVGERTALENRIRGRLAWYRAEVEGK